MNLKKPNLLQDSKDSLVKKLITLDPKTRAQDTTGSMLVQNYHELAGIEKLKHDFILNFGTQIQGQLNISGNAIIEGSVIGDISVSEAIIIGENAVIEGNISGSLIVVFGSVNGDLNASEKLLLCSSDSKSAKVIGNISSKAISIQEGVVFEGGCRMGKSSSISSN